MKTDDFQEVGDIPKPKEGSIIYFPEMNHIGIYDVSFQGRPFFIHDISCSQAITYLDEPPFNNRKKIFYEPIQKKTG